MNNNPRCTVFLLIHDLRVLKKKAALWRYTAAGLWFACWCKQYLANLQQIYQPRCIHLWLFSQETGPLTDLDLQGASQNPHVPVEKTHVGRTHGVTLTQTAFKVLLLFMFVLMGKTTNNILFGASLNIPPKGLLTVGLSTCVLVSMSLGTCRQWRYNLWYLMITYGTCPEIFEDNPTIVGFWSMPGLMI